MDYLKLYGHLTLYWGRLAFPLFAFIAVEGYLHTSNLKKYIKKRKEKRLKKVKS